MSAETIIIIVQMVAAFGVVVSVIYLGIQIHQQNEITKAQFGHSLTHRMYAVSYTHLTLPTKA